MRVAMLDQPMSWFHRLLIHLWNQWYVSIFSDRLLCNYAATTRHRSEYFTANVELSEDSAMIEMALKRLQLLQ